MNFAVIISTDVLFNAHRFSPRQTMLVGMVSQIFLGLATGYAPTYELHILFRCSVAASCSLMCIGIMIGKIKKGLQNLLNSKYNH